MEVITAELEELIDRVGLPKLLEDLSFICADRVETEGGQEDVWEKLERELGNLVPWAERLR